jgi:MFS family permease
MAITERIVDPAIQTESAPPVRAAVRFDAFASRNFTIFWLSLIVTNVGTWMGSVAEGWLITDLEPARKSFYVGLLAIAFAIPMLILPPFGGVLADRLPRLTGIKLTQIAFLILNSTVAMLALTDHITVHVLIVAAFVGAIVLAFDSPIRHSMVPELVPREHMTSAVSLNAVAFSGAGLIGPAVGGLLIPWVGAGGVFLVNAVSTLSVLVALKFLKELPESTRNRPETHGDDPREALVRAIRYIRQTPLMGALFIVALIAGTFGRSYSPMMPVVSRDVYHVGSTANGLLISAAGLGAMTGGLLLSAYASRLANRGRWIAILLVLQGLCLGSVALHCNYKLGLFTLLAMGGLGASAVALVTSIVQEHVPPALRGRVIGFFLLTFISFPSAGAFLMGLLADQTSIQWAFGIFAIVVVALVGYVAVRVPALRHAA